MSLVVLCKKCGRKICGRDEMAGRQFRCPECSTVGQFPQGARPAAAGGGSEICPVCGFDLWVDPDQIQDARGQRFHRACFEEVRPKKRPQALPADEVEIHLAGEPEEPEPKRPSAAAAKSGDESEELGLAPLPEAEPKKAPAKAAAGPGPKPKPAQPSRPKQTSPADDGFLVAAPVGRAAQAAAGQGDSIAVRCGFCSHRFKVPARLVGKKVACPECGDAVQVPRPASKPAVRPKALPTAVLQTPPEATREELLGSLPEALPESPLEDLPEALPEALPLATPEMIPEALPVAMPADDSPFGLPTAMPAGPLATPAAAPSGSSKQPGWFYAVVGIGAAVPVILLVFVIIHMATRPDPSLVARTEQAAVEETAEAEQDDSARSTPEEEPQRQPSRPRPPPTLRPSEPSPPRSRSPADLERADQAEAIVGMVGAMVIGALIGAVVAALPLKLTCVLFSEYASFLKCMGIMLVTAVLNFGVILLANFLVKKTGNPTLALLVVPVNFLVFTTIISNSLSVDIGRAFLIALVTVVFVIGVCFVIGICGGVIIAVIGAAAHSAAGAIL
jgi:hypothetical protein